MVHKLVKLDKMANVGIFQVLCHSSSVFLDSVPL